MILDAPQPARLRGPHDRLPVVLHELGHLVGLEHVADTMRASDSPPASTGTPGALHGLAVVGNGPCFLE